MTTEKMTRAGISRRRFLGTSAGALVVAIGLDGIAGAANVLAATLPPTGQDPNGKWLGGYVVIAPDGTISVIFGGAEMGQGGSTGLAQAVAEELGAAWSDVTIQSAPVGGSFPTGPAWLTGGSSSIRSHIDAMRKAGATAREMLLAAAAPVLGVSAANLIAINSRVQAAVAREAKVA